MYVHSLILSPNTHVMYTAEEVAVWRPASRYGHQIFMYVIFYVAYLNQLLDEVEKSWEWH